MIDFKNINILLKMYSWMTIINKIQTNLNDNTIIARYLVF